MSMTTKTEVSASNFAIEHHQAHQSPKARIYRMADGARIAMTGLVLVIGITVLGLSADSLAIYERTHLGKDFLLPLWPEKFDLRPTTTLVAGSAVVIVSNVVSLLVSKVTSLRVHAGMHTSISLVTPTIGLIAALVSMGLYYQINASTTVDTMQSWTCRWKHVSMLSDPHFGTLCEQNQAAMVLTVLLVPFEVIVIGIAGYQIGLERQLDVIPLIQGRKSSSPNFSS